MSDLDLEEPDGTQEEDVPDELRTGPIVDPTVETDAPDDVTVEGEQGDGEEEQEQEQGEPGVAEARYLSEKDLEKRLDRMYRENERHRGRVAEIMEEDAVHLIPCPVCMDAFHGWIFDPANAPLEQGQRDRMMQLLGLDDFEDIPAAPWAVTCPDCNGHGKVKTGSRREGREITGCLTCNEAGWLNRSGTPAANGHRETAETTQVTGPTVYNREPDPRISALQGEGYTVIPPMVLS